jgi:sugar phosphate isomerase/epimerase
MSNRNRSRSTHRRAVLAGLCLLVFVGPAHAYMDPGSVSIMVTAVLGAIAAVGYTARLYWERFKSMLARAMARLRRDKEPAEE